CTMPMFGCTMSMFGGLGECGRSRGLRRDVDGSLRPRMGLDRERPVSLASLEIRMTGNRR
ncbi:MAG: hypothetical protein KDA62_05240, partial [Planctomycetales bacterium]|nr:hypothetical protein [Planctomycetales bacterium]